MGLFTLWLFPCGSRPRIAEVQPNIRRGDLRFSAAQVAPHRPSCGFVGEDPALPKWLAPGVPASKILESATLIGARALGLGDELGALTPGKRAQMMAVSLPDRVDDVEEFLLGGITPAQLKWLIR